MATFGNANSQPIAHKSNNIVYQSSLDNWHSAGSTIDHEDTCDKTSPTKALALRVHHILTNGGDTDTLICDFYDKASDTFSSVQAQHV